MRDEVRLIEERFPESRRPATHLVRIHPGDCQELGYDDVAHLDGGITSWKESGRDAEVPASQLNP